MKGTRLFVALFVATSTVVLSLAFALLGGRLLTPFYSSAADSITNRLQVSSTHQLPTAGPDAFRVIQVDLTYPASVKEVQSGLVELQYSAMESMVDAPWGFPHVAPGPVHFGIVDVWGGLRPLDRLTDSVEFNLTSSAFDIAPAERAVARERDALPATSMWTITPRRLGRHYVVLRLTDFTEGFHYRLADSRLWGPISPFGSPESASSSGSVRVSLNGKDTSFAASAGLPIPIRVTSVLGLSPLAERLFRIAAFIVAVVVGTGVGWRVKDLRAKRTATRSSDQPSRGASREEQASAAVRSGDSAAKEPPEES